MIMKKEINPAVAAATVVIIIIIGAIFFFRGLNSGVGSKAPGEVGNPSPFDQGGAAHGKGGQKPGGH